jgi:hypothetical protein
MNLLKKSGIIKIIKNSAKTLLQAARTLTFAPIAVKDYLFGNKP